MKVTAAITTGNVARRDDGRDSLFTLGSRKAFCEEVPLERDTNDKKEPASGVLVNNPLLKEKHVLTTLS